jgi:UDPglucose--hexose-1-phosphate uridylyltransferase
VFENDFAALYPDAPDSLLDEQGLLVARSERGVSRVICFSPDHSLTLSRMPVAAITAVVELWTEQFIEIGALPFIRAVIPFENRGAMVGSSNPHPHGQIWASETLPNEMAREERQQREYFAKHGRTLLGDYLALELEREERIVCANDGFVALVPFWAMWPFETMIISRRFVNAMDEMTPDEHALLADLLKRLTTRYDHLFGAPFPYSMGFHQRPVDGAAYPHWHFHAHFYPPLLRSATVRKFVAGFELLGTPQRDITPEEAAARLRACREIF